MNKKKMVFNGSSAIKDYLNPNNYPYTPMVEIDLPKSLQNKNIHIFAKLMSLNPLGNVKAIPSYNMIKSAYECGDLKGVNTLIESSSGNTAFSIASIGCAFGVKKTKAIVSHEILEGKLQLLRLFGTEIEIIEEPICPDPEDKNSGIYKAKEMGTEKGYFNPSQYDNVANPLSHKNLTGKQIWEQTNGNITVFCAGLGTTGTMVGAASFLKKKNKNVQTVGVVRTPNNPVPGPRTASLLKMTAFEWKEYVNHLIEIGTIASFENSLKLIRSGIVVGPSSGFALAGLIKFLEEKSKNKTLKELRNKNGEIVCVFICCDGPLPYLKEYFEYLDDKFFPKVRNEHLLIYKKRKNTQIIHNEDDKIMVTPRKAFKEIFINSEDDVWQKLKDGGEIRLSKNVMVVDIRLPLEFNHFHIPGSINFNSTKINTNILSKLRGKKVYVVCNFGSLSYAFAKSLIKNGILAFSISGGLIEWSNINLPRWKPDVCKK